MTRGQQQKTLTQKPQKEEEGEERKDTEEDENKDDDKEESEEEGIVFDTADLMEEAEELYKTFEQQSAE